MSNDVLAGKDAIRKNELENLIYVLIYLFKGSLPLDGIFSPYDSNKGTKMQSKRKKIAVTVFSGLPEEFVFIEKTIKKSTFLTEPNYGLFKMKLEQIINNQGESIEPDFCFKKRIFQDINA